MAVGDPNQAIYGWRGASVSNIIRFGESFPAADGSTAVTQHSLTVNRRSGSRILELANRMVAAMPEPIAPVDLKVLPLEPPPDAPPGDLHAEVFALRRARAGLAARRGPGGPRPHQP